MNTSKDIKDFFAGRSIKQIATLRAIVELKEKTTTRITQRSGKKAIKTQQLLNHLYRKPVITAKEVEDILGVTAPTANATIKDLLDLQILKELTGMKRHRVFAFSQYLELFEKKDS